MRAPASFPYPASSPPRTVCLVLLAPLLSLAQGIAPTPSHPLAPAADAAHVAAPTAPLAHPALVPQPPLPGATPSPQPWREAHEAVAAFPRGHADIVAWEARQSAQPATPPSTVEGHKSPHSHHHGHHGSSSSNGQSASPTPMHQRHHAPGGKP